jgi:MFS family permease
MTIGQEIAAYEKVPWFPWLGKGKRPYYGWVIVAAAAVENFFTGVVNQGFSTYLSPLQQEFGWSRALLAGPRSVTQIEGAILGPVEGVLVDKFGPRIVIGVGSFLIGLGLILFGMVESLWQYYAASLLIALGNGLAGLLVMSVAINHWFRRRRTIAQSAFLLGYAAAGIVAIPVLVWAQTDFGWRTAAIASGLCVWSFGIPAAMAFRRSPEPYGLQPDGDNSGEALPLSDGRARRAATFSFTFRQAARTPTFWVIAIGNGINGLATSAMMIHLFLHLEDGVGLSRATAALVWTVASLINIPSRLLAGFLGDRLPKHLLLSGCAALMGLSLLTLGLASSLPTALLFAVLYGVGWGARTPVLNAIHGEYWGLASLGKIAGTIHSLAVPLAVIGPVLAGVLADFRGDYRLVFIGMSMGCLIGAGLVLMARPPRPPVKAVVEA